MTVHADGHTEPPQPRPVCPKDGGPLETTADRGRYGRLGHYAVCVWCGRQWMVRLEGDDFDIDAIDGRP